MFLELNQSLYYLIGNSIIRLVVIDELTERTVSKIRSMRPSPSYYVIYASTAKMEELFKTVSDRFTSVCKLLFRLVKLFIVNILIRIIR